MRAARLWLGTSILGLLWATGAVATETQMDAGVFGTVTIYTPEGKPDGVALFISGDGGWELGVVSMARNLVSSQNAVVVGIDVRRYLAQLAKPHNGCRSLAVAVRGAGCQVVRPAWYACMSGSMARRRARLSAGQYFVDDLVGCTTCYDYGLEHLQHLQTCAANTGSRN